MKEKKKVYLVRHPKNLVEKQESFFLGYWALTSKDLISSIENENLSAGKILEYHMSDPNKVINDYDYLLGFYEKSLKSVTSFLNSYHERDLDIQYWRVIIGPWLQIYISTFFDRWETVSALLKEFDNPKTPIFYGETSHKVPVDYQSAVDLYNSDDWNEKAFLNILDFRLDKHNYHVARTNKEITRKTVIRSFKRRLFDKIACKITNYRSRHFPLILKDSYFPFISLLKVFFGLGIKTAWFPDYYNHIYRDIVIDDEYFAHQMQNHFPLGNSQFEQFIFQKILDDIPIAYLEGYSISRRIAQELPSAKVAFTANAHIYHEIFKFWMAENSERIDDSIIVVSDHGGAFLALKTGLFEHEESISTIRTVWHKPYKNKHLMLPPNKYPTFRIRKIRINKKNDTRKNEILLIGFEHTRYLFRFDTSVLSSLNVEEIKQKNAFLKLLNQSVRKNIVLRPYKDRGWGSGKILKNLHPEISIDTRKHLLDSILNSRIIICSYPQTSFFEAILCNKPTILLMLEEFWKIHPIFFEIYTKFKELGIIHCSIQSAANFLNKPYKDIDEWWEGESVQQARSEFFDIVGKPEKSMSKWIVFFKSLISER